MPPTTTVEVSAPLGHSVVLLLTPLTVASTIAIGITVKIRSAVVRRLRSRSG